MGRGTGQRERGSDVRRASEGEPAGRRETDSDKRHITEELVCTFASESSDNQSSGTAALSVELESPILVFDQGVECERD